MYESLQTTGIYTTKNKNVNIKKFNISLNNTILKIKIQQKYIKNISNTQIPMDIEQFLAQITNSISHLIL